MAYVVDLRSISTTFYAQLFVHTDPESAKKKDNLTVFFALLGTVRIKAGCRKLMKLTPAVNFTNILKAAFAPTLF